MTVAIAPFSDAKASDIGLRNGALNEATRDLNLSTPYTAPKSNPLEAVGAALWRENTLASVWHMVTDGYTERTLPAVSGYNPYRELKTVYDKDTLEKLRGSISDGDFDHVRSEAQLRMVVDDILKEQEAQKQMSDQGMAYFGGSLLASVLDPVSYLPFVDGAKFARLGKVGLGALNATLGAGVSEGILQMTQDNRPIQESLMNIGSSAIIGGGLGVFAAALHPHSHMNPDNPDNVFARENLRKHGEITRDLTGASDEISAAELEDLQRHYVSAGAAAVRGSNGFRIARSEPTTPVGKAVRKVGDFFNSATIKGQVLRSNSPAARWLGVRIFDPSGIISEGNLKGIANARSATILKHMMMVEHEELAAIMEAQTRQLSMDSGTKVSHKDMMLLTQRHLYAMTEGDPKVAKLAEKYGDTFAAMDAQAQKNAERIHKQNGIWEARLADRGKLQDVGLVSRLSGELQTLRDQIKTTPAPAKGSPEEAALNALRDKKNEVRKALMVEKDKPAPLGRDYGHAQLWNRDAIFQAPSAFKAFLHDILAFRPDEKWLIENHDMTLDQFDKLSKEDQRPIREEWAGDEKGWQIDQLQHQLKAQEHALKEAKLDLREAFKWFGVLEDRETNLSLSEARKKRDAVWAKVNATRDPELKARAEALDALWRKVDETHTDIKRSRQELEKGIKDAKAARAELEADAKKTGKALAKANKRPALNDVVDQIYEAMSSTGHMPANLVNALTERSDREVGRVKARQLTMDRTQRAEAINKGWLRDDLSNILLSSHDQLASEISLNDAIGIGPGKEFSSWEDALKYVEEDYQQMIEEASNQATKNHLDQERKATVKNIVEARDRLKGGSHVDDGTSNGWFRWGSNMMKRTNMIRYGSGFLLSSLTDTATMTLRHGNLAGLMQRYGTRAIEVMRAAADEDMSAFKSMIRAIEVGQGAHASAKRFGTEDALHGQLIGYGIGVGTTRKITGKIDEVTEKMSEIGIKMGGLPLWNTFWKTVAGLHMLDQLHSMTKRYGELADHEIADLATLGIGRGEAERIAKYMAEHGETDAAGHFDAHFEKWAGEDGQDAATTARLAIMRDMNRAINTPDGGDTPRFMSTHMGSMLMSFQTFAFAFMNQYAYPLAQRMSLFHEKQAYMSLAILLGSAMMVMAGKDIINGRDPRDRLTPEKWSQTAYELVDRSGLLGYMSPYADSVLKLTSPITKFAGGDRYVRNGWLESLLGINFALVQDAQKAGAAVFADDPDKVRKMLTIVPYAAQAKLLGRIFESVTQH